MTRPSGVSVNAAVCVGCGACIESCPTDVLRLADNGKAFAAFPDDCQFCFLCVFDCPVNAISISIARLPDLPKWWNHWAGPRVKADS